MNWLRNFFKLESPKAPLIHPILGEMTSYKRENGKTVWESGEDVQSQIGPAQVIVDGDENGPFTELIQNWQKIVGNFAIWEASAESHLRKDLAAWGWESLFHELRVCGFHFPAPGSESYDWNVMFELECKSSWYTVHFKDDEVAWTEMDG